MGRIIKGDPGVRRLRIKSQNDDIGSNQGKLIFGAKKCHFSGPFFERFALKSSKRVFLGVAGRAGRPAAQFTL